MTTAAALDENDNRWSLHGEVEKVFKTALKHTFTDYLDVSDEEAFIVPLIVPLKDNKFGDYQCNNILRIWPKLRDKDTYKNSKSVGAAIMNNVNSPDMMECNIGGPGFITIKLLSQWIAKSIYKMLIDGIDTWAPKLPMKKAIVDLSSRNLGEEMNMGHLRSTIIGDTIARMFEYSKVHVIRRSHVTDGDILIGMLIEFLLESFPNGEVNYQAIGKLEVFCKETKKRFDEDAEFRERAHRALVCLQIGDKRYLNAWAQICEMDRKGYTEVYQRLGVHVEQKCKSFYNPYIPETLDLLRQQDGLIEKSEGNAVIFIEEEELYGVTLPEGKRLPLTVLKRDGGLDYAITDLTALRYQLEVEKADWLLYVSDISQREHTELCIYAAQHAKWLVADWEKYPRGSYVGFDHVQVDDLQTFQDHSPRVVDLLDGAKARCKATLLKQNNANEWTAEKLDRIAKSLGYGSVKYADLKNCRLEKHTFNFDQMFNDTENTIIHLVHVYGRLCSVISNSGKDMNELKKAGEIKLETSEERELGLYLLKFSEAIERSCKYVLPHILCEYLYNLSEKLNSFYSKFLNSSVGVSAEEETRRVLVFEPSSPVLRKCSVACEETNSRLLLCEAAVMVMEKCFHLLGISLL